METKGYLLLEDGSLFEGILLGAKKDCTAQLVFTTSVVGYMETLTDARYEGQIVVQTFPCIGNYGVVALEGGMPQPRLSGYVAREICDAPSNFRCEGKLEDYLIENDIPCLTDVDTRALTRRIRDKGVMNAAILTSKPADMAAAVEALKAAQYDVEPDGQAEEIIPAGGKGLYHVALWDLGNGSDIRRELEKRGCTVSVAPAGATAQAILALNPDGVLLSGGAGDPAQQEDLLQELQALCESGLPMMGIGLGHQLMALCRGAQVVALPYGHRGGNQPVKDVKTGANYITSQNHGFAVDAQTLPENASVRFINTNDGSCEGVDYTDMPAFSVQFMPEACGGPMDTRYLFERFIALMGGNKECR